MIFELIFVTIFFGFFAAIFYYFSLKSRKTYYCPECGEIIMVEHMDTSRCGVCGSSLKEDEKA